MLYYHFTQIVDIIETWECYLKIVLITPGFLNSCQPFISLIQNYFMFLLLSHYINYQ